MSRPAAPDRRPATAVLAAVAAVAVAMAACGGGAPSRFEVDPSEAATYPTAHIRSVVADPDGPDVEEGGGEHVVIANNWDLEADLGGWAIEDADGNRLRLPPSTKLAGGAELRVYVSRGEDTAEEVFAGLDEEVLDDDGDTIRLLDAGSSVVAEFTYGD